MYITKSPAWGQKVRIFCARNSQFIAAKCSKSKALTFREKDFAFEEFSTFSL